MGGQLYLQIPLGEEKCDFCFCFCCCFFFCVFCLFCFFCCCYFCPHFPLFSETKICFAFFPSFFFFSWYSFWFSVATIPYSIHYHLIAVPVVVLIYHHSQKTGCDNLLKKDCCWDFKKKSPFHIFEVFFRVKISIAHPFFASKLPEGKKNLQTRYIF